MAGNLADCMPTASCRLRPTPTRPSSEAPTSPARCSQTRSHCFSLPCSFSSPSFPPRAACHDCWHLTTFISSSLEARSILCPQPVCKNLSRTQFRLEGCDTMGKWNRNVSQRHKKGTAERYSDDGDQTTSLLRRTPEILSHRCWPD